MNNINERKRINKKFLLSSLLCLVPVIVGMFIYNTLPEQIPTHWNLQGYVDGYSTKFVAVILLPMSMFICDLIMKIVIINDPKSKKRVYPKPVIMLIAFLLPILNMFIFSAQVVATKTFINFSISSMIFCFIGIIFVILGLYLPEIEQNYVIGIKIPWTLNDEENWNKTHKVAGITFIVSGILFIINALFIKSPNVAIFMIIFSIFIILVIPTVYSLYMYIHQNKKDYF